MNIKLVNILLVVPCICILLISCSSTEDEFITQLNEDSNKEICSKEINHTLDVVLFKGRSGNLVFANDNRVVRDKSGNWKRMNLGEDMLIKLSKNGYVEEKPIKINQTFGRNKGYKITEKGLKYFKYGGQTCFGDRVATKIVEYTEPAEKNGEMISRVTFLYDVRLNDMANDLDLEEILRDKENINGKGVAKFIKTNNGWDLSWGW